MRHYYGTCVTWTVRQFVTLVLKHTSIRVLSLRTDIPQQMYSQTVKNQNITCRKQSYVLFCYSRKCIKQNAVSILDSDASIDVIFEFGKSFRDVRCEDSSGIIPCFIFNTNNGFFDINKLFLFFVIRLRRTQ